MNKPYRPFETINLALYQRLKRKRLTIEVEQRVCGQKLSYNVDDFEEDKHDLYERHSLNGIKKDLPANGTIYVAAYTPDQNADFLNDFVLTLRDKQVVAIEGEPWQAPMKSCDKDITPERQAAARELIAATVKQGLTLLRRSKRFNASNATAPKVKISFHPDRRKSYGGSRGLSFALNHYVRNDTAVLMEYASFAKDPAIGTLAGSWQMVVKALVCHELAHWAQFAPRVTREPGLDYKSPHGNGFKEIYEYLRTRILKGNDAT